MFLLAQPTTIPLVTLAVSRVKKSPVPKILAMFKTNQGLTTSQKSFEIKQFTWPSNALCAN